MHYIYIHLNKRKTYKRYCFPLLFCILLLPGLNNKFLKGSSVHIHEDYSSEVADERNTLYPIYKKVLSSRPKINVKLSGSVLQIAGKRYTYSNFTDIPDNHHNLLPVTTRHSEEIHVFYGQWNSLSSMYPCVFEMDGLIFRSSEHYFQFKKRTVLWKKWTGGWDLVLSAPDAMSPSCKTLDFWLFRK